MVINKRTFRERIADTARAFIDKVGKPAFAGTPFPTGDVDQPEQMEAELGGTGTFLFGGFIRGEDPNQEMDGLTGIKNLDEMRRGDSQVHAALEVVKMPIRTATYEVDPSDPNDPDSVRIAEFVRWNLFSAMSTTWDDLIRQSLLMLDFGFMLFEKVWTVQDDGEWQGYMRLQKLAPRPPKTVWQWFPDEDGQLLSIKQLAVKAGSYQFLDIPAHKLVRFTFQQEGDNWMGISMLRTAYAHWRIKKQLYVIDAIRATRFGVGIPRAKLMAGYKPTSEDRAALAQLLQGMSSHQHAYVIEPPQVTIDILMPQGVQGGAQLLPSIQHQNEQITRNILAQFLDMGGRASGGSRALGSSAMNFFLNAIEAIANQICDVLNKQVIKDLVDMNFDTDKYPRLRPAGIADSDVKGLALAVAALAQAKLLTPDRNTENTLRNLLNLPEMSGEWQAQGDDPTLDPTAVDPTTGAPMNPNAAPDPNDPNAQPVPDDPMDMDPTVVAAKAAAAAGTPATPATSTPVPAKKAAPAPVQAKPATSKSTPANFKPHPVPAKTTAKAGPAKHTVTQPVEASSTATGTRPATLQMPPTDPVVPMPTMPRDDGWSVNQNPQTMRPAIPATSAAQPAMDHGPMAPSVARPGTYDTTPAHTTYETAVPAVSDVREPMQAVVTNQPRSSTQIASSGAADEEGHPLSEVALRSKSQRNARRWTTEDGQTSFWRQPTVFETKVLDLREVPRRLASAQSALLSTLRGVREEQISRIAAAVAHADDASELKPPLVGKMASDIQKVMKEVFEYGQTQVKAELKRQTRDGVSMGDWDESQHPRGERGEFTYAGGGASRGHAPRHDDYYATPSDALEELMNGGTVTIASHDVRGLVERAAGRGLHADLSRVQVEGKPVFRGGLNMARKDMPQIPRDHQDKFLNEMKARAIFVTHQNVDPLTLKASQKEIDAANVGEKIATMENKAKPVRGILISKDNYVLDGHHRWAGAVVERLESKEAKIAVLRLNVDHTRALREMNEYVTRHHIARSEFGKVAASEQFVMDEQGWDFDA